MSLRDELLAMDSRPVKEIDVPVWGKITIRKLSVVDADNVRKGVDTDLPDSLVRAVIVGVVDPVTKLPAFTLADVAELLKIASDIITFLGTEIIKFSAVTPAAVADAKKD